MNHPLVFLLFAVVSAPLFAQDPLAVESLTVTPGVEIEVVYKDQQVGGVRYEMESSANLTSWTEVTDALLENLGGGRYGLKGEWDNGATRQFLRVRSRAVPATVGFELGAITVDEGSGQQQVLVRFSDRSGAPLIYNGPVRYEWSGAVYLVSELSGEVMANGTEVAIPFTVGDDAGLAPLRQVTLKLQVDASTGYAVDPVAQSLTLTIDENDNYWRGSFQAGNELIDLEIFTRFENELLLVFLTHGTAFLESGFPVASGPVFTDSQFVGAFPLFTIAATPENLLAAGTQVRITLTADEGNGTDIVSKTELSGSGAFEISHPDKPHLTGVLQGRFFLRKDAPLQPNEELVLE